MLICKINSFASAVQNERISVRFHALFYVRGQTNSQLSNSSPEKSYTGSLGAYGGVVWCSFSYPLMCQTICSQHPDACYTDHVLLCCAFEWWMLLPGHELKHPHVLIFFPRECRGNDFRFYELFQWDVCDNWLFWTQCSDGGDGWTEGMTPGSKDREGDGGWGGCIR